jgi:hypothetical protein
MFLPQTMLVLSAQTIDELIISPLRDTATYKLNTWRNLVAQAMGFSNYHHLMKHEFVLFEAGCMCPLLNLSATENLYDITGNLCTWYIPASVSGYLCVGKYNDINRFDSTLYDDDGRGLWSREMEFYRLGNICMSKDEAKRFVADLNEQAEDLDFALGLENTLDKYEHVERSHPCEWWEHMDSKLRDNFLNCRTKHQLYSEVANFVREDGESYFASWGFTISEFVKELLDDENLAFSV